ncbi:hypothetical protein [Corynebacterium glyciniphilum]|uniref:hypothetical protein n=1 Tax=Corynebacterium glyciniphilum TaxID=1404244 RepID=UPI003FD27D64
MTIRRSALAALFAIPLVLTACGNDDQDSPPTTSSTTSTTTSTTSSSTSSTTSRTTTETPEPEPVAEDPPVGEPETASAEPYVVECLEGTPGPAMWSDGTMGHSEDCWINNGGPAYAEAEGNATEQFWRDNPELLNQPDPSTIPVWQGGTCSYAVCGYPPGEPAPGTMQAEVAEGCRSGQLVGAGCEQYL